MCPAANEPCTPAEACTHILAEPGEQLTPCAARHLLTGKPVVTLEWCALRIDHLSCHASLALEVHAWPPRRPLRFVKVRKMRVLKMRDHLNVACNPPDSLRCRRMRRLRAWADRAAPHDPPPDAAAHAARLACGDRDVDTGALPAHARLLGDCSFAVLLGTQQEVAALLGAAGARVRACAGCGDVQAAGMEVLVLPQGQTAPAEVPWTDAARILVSRALSCGVLMLMGGPALSGLLMGHGPAPVTRDIRRGELVSCRRDAGIATQCKLCRGRDAA